MEDDETQDSIHALQSGHSRQTENHLYGITAEALAGAAEDVLPLYLDASTDWQVACHVVPGGHMLPYTEAISSNFSYLASHNKIKVNYSTPVTTMEQVTERVLKEIDVKLEKQTQVLLDCMNQNYGNAFITQAMQSMQEKMNQAMEQLAHSLSASNCQMCYISLTLGY